MPKNRQAVPAREYRDGHSEQPTAHSDCYISLSWWEWSPTVQLGTIRPDGIVAELNGDGSGLHIIADGTQPDQANEPGWFVDLDEAGLKEHIRQCRRAGRRVFGWGKKDAGLLTLPQITAARGGVQYGVSGDAGWCAPPATTYDPAAMGGPTQACPGWPACGGSHEWWKALDPVDGIDHSVKVTCLPPRDAAACAEIPCPDFEPVDLEVVERHLPKQLQPSDLPVLVCKMGNYGSGPVVIRPAHNGHTWSQSKIAGDPDQDLLWCPGVPR